MPLINSNYVALFPLQEQLWDKDLNVPLAAGYIQFFSDVAPTVPQDVYVQTQSPGPTYSYTNIGSTVTLSSIGTTQYLGTDSIIFLYPYDANGNLQTYFIQVFSSTNVLQFTRFNWPPGAAANAASSGFSQSQNIISNPQFSNVLFNSSIGVTVNVTGSTTTAIAPDWNVITTGTGSFTVNQIALTDDTAPGEPSFALDIVSASIDTLILSQRITNSPRILENNFASATFIAQAIAPTSSAIITMNYVPSLGALIPLLVGTAVPGAFTSFSATTATVIPQTNTQSPLIGYVDIQYVIPVGTHIQISCAQLVSVVNATTVAQYVQESVPSQINRLFHYYNPLLMFKPIPSLLTGWDFPLNPTQFGSSKTANTTASYIWDQTIIGTLVGNVSIARDPNIGSLVATTTNANESFYLLQYLSGAQAVKTTLSNLCVNFQGYSPGFSNVTAIINLYYSSLGGTIPTLPTTIGTIGAGGVFTLTPSNNWTIIDQFIQNNQFNVNSSSSQPDNNINGWNGLANFDSTSITNFAIVVTFNCPTTGTFIDLLSISLDQGDIPTRPAPQSQDEVLRECQYYYESSYALNVPPGTAGAGGSLFAEQTTTYTGGTTNNVIARGFGLQFKTIKRSVGPVITFYSDITGTINNVSTSLFVNGGDVNDADTGLNPAAPSGSWSEQYKSSTGVTYFANTVTALQSFVSANTVPEGIIGYHYTCDARLGKIA